MMTSAASSSSRKMSSEYANASNRLAPGLDLGTGNPFLRKSLIGASGQLQQEIERDLNRIHYEMIPRRDYRN